MYITKQINQNECGVCVLNTLFYHFFRKDIKMELLRDANISDQGLNIYELENLGLKYGMRLESYQIDFAEFKQLKNNNLLIVLVERNGSPHYTLVKKNKNSLIMFDSVNGRVETTYQEIEPTFKNIVIIPTKQTFKIKINEQKVIIKPHYHLKYISFVILIQLLIIIASVIGSNYISEIINKSLSIGSIKNILVVSFGYGIVFVLENIATYISKLVIGRQSRDIAKILSSNYIEKLKYKNYEFLCKCDKKYFYLIENAINIIANYNAFELTQFIASCVSSIILTIILTIINISYLLTIFCAVVLLVGCTLIHYYYSKEIIKKTFSNIAISEETNTKIAQYITYHHNTYALNKITTDLKNNFFEMSTIAKNSNLINASHKSCISIIEKLLLIIIVGLSTYQILNIEQNLTIAKTILSINLIGILWMNINNISNFAIVRMQYKKMLEIYKIFIMVGNKKNGAITLENIPNKISLIKNQQTYELKSGSVLNHDQRTFIDCITKFKNNDADVFLNNINANELSNVWINKHIMVFEPYMVLYNWEDILNLLHDYPIIAEFVKKFNFKIRPNSFHIDINYTQIINLLFCLTISNKILILNNCLKYIDKQYTSYITDTIMPVIEKNNFLIICDDNYSIKHNG